MNTGFIPDRKADPRPLPDPSPCAIPTPNPNRAGTPSLKLVGLKARMDCGGVDGPRRLHGLGEYLPKSCRVIAEDLPESGLLVENGHASQARLSPLGTFSIRRKS